MIDIAQLMPPAEQPFDMPQHARTLALLCGEALQQTSGGPHDIMDGQPGHLFVLTRREGHEQIAARYAHLNQPGLAGQGEALANLLDNVANQYEAGQGPLRRETGEEYLAVALIARGFEVVDPDARIISAERLHGMVAAGRAEMVMRGVGISADHYRAYTWLKPEQDGVQGWLLEPGEPWPEASAYLPMMVNLHERLSVS